MIARTGSVAIKTDNVHYKSDLMLNGSVIVALVLDQALRIAGADAVFGIGIALWLLWGAWRASSEAVDQLMDREWPEEERQHFLAAAPQISRARGPPRPAHPQERHLRFVQFHVWVPADGRCRRRTTGSTRVEEELAASASPAPRS